MDVTEKILIVDDERAIVNFITSVLNSHGYKTVEAYNIKNATMMLASHCPDVILLDLGLPDGDGQDFIKKTRIWSNIPIIVISARNHESDKIQALDNGADDYITKPFGSGELLARIRTALRHSHKRDVNISQFKAGNLTVDFNKHRVYIDGKDVDLTNNEFKIITLLAENSGKVLTYDAIIEKLWGSAFSTNNQTLRVHMTNLRHKIEKNPALPEYIFTEIGVGYRLIEGDFA